MVKKASVLTRPPRCAKTHHSTGKAVASEEARRTLRYVERLSDATCLREALRRRQGTKLADFFNILLADPRQLLTRQQIENAVGAQDGLQDDGR